MRHKILVADDDSDNRAIALACLVAGGYEVAQASNGAEVLEHLDREQPKLIFLDLSMPKLDGWQTVKKIKSDSRLREIPVVAFSAHAMVGDEKKALDAGCDDYISKPCAPKSLLEKAHKWTGGL